jgi:hypothetical protein
MKRNPRISRKSISGELKARFPVAFMVIKKLLPTPRMIEQPRFPKMTRNHVHQFYHACIYNKEDTKKAFIRYVEVRGDFVIHHQKHEPAFTALTF